MIQKKSKRALSAAIMSSASLDEFAVPGEVSFTVLNTGAGIHSFHSCDVQSLQLGKVRYQTGSTPWVFRCLLCSDGIC